jgi:hypothetical protein
VFEPLPAAPAVLTAPAWPAGSGSLRTSSTSGTKHDTTAKPDNPSMLPKRRIKPLLTCPREPPQVFWPNARFPGQLSGLELARQLAFGDRPSSR